MLYEKLRQQREALYKQFDSLGSPTDLFEIQVALAKAIMESETNRGVGSDKDEWSFHLDRLYSIGDSLAWLVMDGFTIRQLGQYESLRTSLTGQEGDYVSFLYRNAETAMQSILIFCDLTRCITIGDIVIVNGPDDISLVECKGVHPSMPTATSLLQGRNGRQFSRMFWLTNYLKDGFGQLYRREKPTKVFEINTTHSSHFPYIPQLITDCLEKGTAFIQAEPGLVYLANLPDADEFDNLNHEPELRAILRRFQSPFLAGTGRLVEENRETIYHMPALTFPVDLHSRILLTEVDINIIGILDIGYLNDLSSLKGYAFSYTSATLPCLKRGEKEYCFNIRFLNDILINFTTVESVIDTMITLIEKIEETKGELTKEEKENIENRPKTLAEMIRFMETNYAIVKLDPEGNVLEAYHMNGEKIE